MIDLNICESTQHTRKASIVSSTQWREAYDMANSTKELSRSLYRLATEVTHSLETATSWRSNAATAMSQHLTQHIETIDLTAFLCHHVQLFCHDTIFKLEETARQIRQHHTQRSHLVAQAQHIAQNYETGTHSGETRRHAAQLETEILDTDRQLRCLCERLDQHLEELGQNIRHATSLLPEPNKIPSWAACKHSPDNTDKAIGPLVNTLDALYITSVLATLKRYRHLRAATPNSAPLSTANLAQMRQLLQKLTPRQRQLVAELSPQVCQDLTYDMAPTKILTQRFPPGTVEHRFFTELRHHHRQNQKPPTPNLPIPDLPAHSLQLHGENYRAQVNISESAQHISHVRKAWESLTPDQQSYLTCAYPTVIGTLQGIPPESRFQANRITLHGHYNHITTTLAATRSTPKLATTSTTEHETPNVADLQRRSTAYKRPLTERFPENPGKGQRQILSFDPTGNGQLVEVIGTLDDNTTNIGTFVPGTGTTITNHDHYVRSGRHFLSYGNPKTMAQVIFTDGHYPQSIREAAQRHDAHLTGQLLAIQQAELATIAPQAKLTVTGHSYGGAIVGVAETYRMPADDVIHLSSAGMGAPLDVAAEPVTTSEGYPETDLVGRPKWQTSQSPGTQRWTHTPRGDVISLAQEGSDLIPGTGHGADPEDFPGIRVLPTGRYLSGFDEPELIGKPLANLELKWGTGVDVHRHVHEPYTETARYVAEISYTNTVSDHVVVPSQSGSAEPLARRVRRTTAPRAIVEVIE